MRRLGTATLAALLALLAPALGCSTKAALAPAPTAITPEGAPFTALGEQAGVRLEVETRSWTGHPDVEDEVTPLRLTVQNDSGQSVRLRYLDLALVGPGDRTFRALPPYAIEGDIDAPRLADRYAPFFSPGFGYSGFDVLPHYGPLYPGMGTYAGPGYYDPYYYGLYDYWNVPLPTAHMLRVALPEGTLEDGGYVTGFVYFEKVDPEIGAVTLHYRLVNAATGDVFGTIEVPLLVGEAD